MNFVLHGSSVSGGITIGHANATAKFKADGTYAAAINGSTNGLTKLVADARAVDRKSVV